MAETDSNGDVNGVGTSTKPSSLIQHGTIVNADFTQQADILVGSNGKILKIAKNIVLDGDTGDNVKVVDATGKYVLPGGIDPHVHLELTFMEQISETPETGTKCAIQGGTTTVIDFIIPPPVVQDGILLKTYEQWKAKYSGRASCNYSFHGCITKWDESMNRQIQDLAETAGINSFKMFMAYKNALMLDDASLVHGFQRCKELGILPAVHAENGELVSFLQDRVFREQQVTGPEGHPLSRPVRVESEACGKSCLPIMMVHSVYCFFFFFFYEWIAVGC